jgi:deferrochelatase/peroxidase EfeB
MDTWDAHFQEEIHGMLLIADNNDAARDAKRAEILDLIDKSGGSVKFLGQEEGRAMRNADDHGIEHFGYVDGRSQPLMLQEDIDKEDKELGGIDQWDPTIPLSQVLLPCPGGGAPTSFGSYFVFRKLEQNVRGFKKQEKELAKFL